MLREAKPRDGTQGVSDFVRQALDLQDRLALRPHYPPPDPPLHQIPTVEQLFDLAPEQ